MIANDELLLLIAVAAVATFLLRALPLVLLRKPIKNPYLVALLNYLPYALLSAMVFPAALYSTAPAEMKLAFPSAPFMPSVAGTVVAAILSFFRCNLPVVAAAATVTAYVASLFL